MLLRSYAENQLTPLGRLAGDLWLLDQAGLLVAPTVVLGPPVVLEYLRTGTISEDLVDACLGKLRPSEHIRVQVSLPVEYHGLPRTRTTPADCSAVGSQVARIYRAWDDDRSRASRIARQIADQDSYPSVLLQPSGGEDNFATSRLLESGRKTTVDRYRPDARNTFPSADEGLTRVLAAAELAIVSPLGLGFSCRSEGIGREIFFVERLDSSPALAWTLLKERLDSGSIDARSFLRSIKPEMIVAEGDTAMVATDSSRTVVGAPSGPGVAIGHLAIARSGAAPETGRPTVLCADTYAPDHLGQMLAAEGIVSNGGRTDHAALVARQYGIPCVVRAGIQVDADAGSVLFPSGTAVPEGIMVVLDGRAGILSACDSLGVQQVFAIRPEVREDIAWLTGHIDEVSGADQGHPDDGFEQHLALLRHCLRVAR